MQVPASVSINTLPAVRVLGNGRYTVMVHGNGGGFSRFDGWALNDWNGDRLQEQGGWQFYVRDLDSGRIYRFGAQPLASTTRIEGEAGVVTIREHVGDVTLTMRVHVAASHAAEVRQLHFHNGSGHAMRMQITAYLPIALNHPAAHSAHPAFSKLFVQTEFYAEAQALLARRRPRAAGEHAPWMSARLDGPGELRWDTDRAKFLGRGWGLSSPQGVVEGLAAHQTNVLDPAFVMQRSLIVNAGDAAELTLVLGAAENREHALALIQQPLSQLAPASESALNVADAGTLQALAGALFYGWPDVGVASAIRKAVSGHPGVVWGYGMPSDRPFVLVDSRNSAVQQWALHAQRYWRMLGLDIPMLVLTDDVTTVLPLPGVVVRDRASVSESDLRGVRAVAAGAFDDNVAGKLVAGEPVVGDLAGGNAASATPPAVPAAITSAPSRILPALTPSLGSAEPLTFDNGYGGFTADGREYVVRLSSTGERLMLPPVPWVNILANPDFGCLVSETGAGSVWSVNSRERRITPWTNDPVLNPHDEAIYLQDNATGAVWSPQPGPALSGGDYETRHGFGYTRFVHACAHLQQITTVFVHRTLPVRVSRLQLSNTSDQPRKITVVSYQRLVLGFVPAQSAAFVSVNVNAERRSLRAANTMAGEFANQMAFANCVANAEIAWQACTDRQLFLGSTGHIAWPAGLQNDAVFAQPATQGQDPCFAQRITLEIPPQTAVAVSFLLGDAANEQQMQACFAALDSDEKVLAALAEVQNFWRETLSAVQVDTPSKALDFMLNGWLLYQTLVCRIWGRTAFYQSSGAFGFRDQLQDSGALVYARPDLTRKQILLHASRQFAEGDVQHWWHEPPVDRGLRTRFSDDLNWLPLLTSFYIKSTGDQSLLGEMAPFLTAPLLHPGEDEVYLQAQLSGQEADIYEHCCRALDISLTKGRHGLPLMGTGDWNDGMNRVGREGKGESVWMGFFLYYILGEFLPFCEQRQDATRVQRYREYREHLAVALNADGWDGEWYRRAWYDNGDPVGSKESDECQIDALAQAWAVISGVAPFGRASQALGSLEKRLVDPLGKLIRLLAPSFINTPNDPGYIKGYVAGVRENGGQYTHAASWVVRAMAEAGRTDRAFALLDMILPIAHTSCRADTDIYKTEPYVAVADIYGDAPHVGRGGWTWYTGSSGWLYRVGLESVLGLNLAEGQVLQLKPCVPAEWGAYTLRYRMPQGGNVTIEVQCQAASRSVYLDDVEQPQSSESLLRVRITDPSADHRVRVCWRA